MTDLEKRIAEIKDRLIDFDATVTNDLGYDEYKLFTPYIADIYTLLNQLKRHMKALEHCKEQRDSTAYENISSRVMNEEIDQILNGGGE